MECRELQKYLNIKTTADSFVHNTRQSFLIEAAIPRDTQSLRNWLDLNACIDGPEIKYLQDENDLMSLGLGGDSVARAVEIWMEDKLIAYCPGFRKVR